MTQKHTPGPWVMSDMRKIAFEDGTSGSIDIQPENGGIWIASVHGTHVGDKDDAINKANAALIAAAPDLLEALKQMKGLRMGAVPIKIIESEAKRIYALCNAAIAKAEQVGA